MKRTIYGQRSTVQIPRAPEPVKWYGRTIAPEDLEDHKTGVRIIETLKLKVIRTGSDKGRVRTDWGTKSPAGVIRTLRRYDIPE